jgi:hypothetical protein
MIPGQRDKVFAAVRVFYKEGGYVFLFVKESGCGE